MAVVKLCVCLCLFQAVLGKEEKGRYQAAVLSQKLGEPCSSNTQCNDGLVCEEVASGGTRVCRQPTAGSKQYYKECSTSSECDVSRGLCCTLLRRHRQKHRKACSYFQEPLVCIGPVAADQIRTFVQLTSGEKRVGVS